MRKKRLSVALATGVLSIGMTAISPADTWLEDPQTGCQVWSDGDASDKEIATWSGSCMGDKASGQGVLVVHDKKGLLATYKGEMLTGKGDGFGFLSYRNDKTGDFDDYLGGFENGLPMGDGIFDSSEGWRFEASFNGSFDNGSGSLRLYAEDDGANDAVIRGEFKDGKLTGSALAFYESKNGEAYFGEVENGKREGFGTLVHANDDAYIGEFADGKASGPGNYETADGSMMVGIYKDGAPNGPGTYIATNGDAYQGTFIDGKVEGIVLITKADGSQIMETWKNGEKQK